MVELKQNKIWFKKFN